MFAIAPKTFEKFINAVLSSSLLTFGGIVWIVGGLYLSWVGFFG